MKGDRDPRLPGGENARELTERLRQGLVGINSRGDDRSILVVTHGGILVYSLHEALGIPRPPEVCTTPIHNCAVIRLELDYDPELLTGRIASWMDASHIKGEAANFVCGFPTTRTATSAVCRTASGRRKHE
jgi:broad specificity phosphatase PhoE